MHLKSVTALFALAMAMFVSPLRADTVPIEPDPLHGICTGCAHVTIGGNDVTLMGPNGLSSFGFASSPPNATGDLQLKFLIPNSFTLAQVQAFDAAVNVVSGTGVTSDISLYSTTAWTSGFLETDYLNNTLAPGAPKNPLDAWLGATNEVLANDATGYYLLTAQVGQFTLGGVSDALALAATFALDPLFYAQGGLIVGNLFTANGVISTAQSGALFNGQPSGGPFCATPPCGTPFIVPGPIAGAGFLPLLGLGWWFWRRRREDEELA